MLHYVECRQCHRFTELRTERESVPLCCAWCGRRFHPLCGHGGAAGQAPPTLLSAADRVRNDLCRVCGCVLSLRQAIEKTCDNPQCRAAYREIQSREAIEKWSRRSRYAVVARAKARRWFRIAKTELPAFSAREWHASGVPAVLLLPANTRRLAGLPESRKQELVRQIETLAGKMNEANEAANTLEENPGWSAEAFPETSPWNGSCAVCRGYCCQSGGTHAYVREAQIARYIRSHHGAGLEDAVRAYASYLPPASFSGGCVYQGEDGCTLPLEMRSGVCLSFYCEEYHRVREWFRANIGVPVLLAAVDRGRVYHLALFDGRRLHSVGLPARPDQPPSFGESPVACVV